MADNEAVERDEDQADATGGDSPEGKSRQREETDPPAGASDEDGGGDDERSEESRKAQEKQEEREQAKETMEKIEEDPPENLEDWPDDAAKYETFGGPEGGHGYHEGPEEEKLGPSSLRHHEGGDVTIEGEQVDDPDKYKSDPIPGGPTDENSSDLTAQRIRERQERTEPGERGPDDEQKDDSVTKGSSDDS